MVLFDIGFIRIHPEQCPFFFFYAPLSQVPVVFSNSLVPIQDFLSSRFYNTEEALTILIGCFSAFFLTFLFFFF